MAGPRTTTRGTTRADRPSFDFWPLLFANVTVRLLGSDDFPDEAKQHAATDLTAAAAAGDLEIGVAPPFPLEATAAAHDQVDTDNRRRVLVALSPSAAAPRA